MTIDRRIRKSQVAMRNAFIELLHQHQLEEITVQQIADLADVNRSTFIRIIMINMICLKIRGPAVGGNKRLHSWWEVKWSS